MNTVYNYDFVVTLEGDVSSPSSIELHTYTVLVLTFISVVVVLFCWSPVSLATVPFPFLTPTPTTVDRYSHHDLSKTTLRICTPFIYLLSRIDGSKSDCQSLSYFGQIKK